MTQVTAPSEKSLWTSLQDPEIYRVFWRNATASYGKQEAVVHLLIGVLLLTAVTMFCLNSLVFHFTTFITLNLLLPIPLFLLWWFIGHSHRSRWPRFGLLAATVANVGLSAVVFIIVWASILTTPFVIIDYHLVQWDRWLGFDVTALMAWVQQFPWLIRILEFSYYSWLPQVILTPILLALLKKPQEINRYFAASAIGLMCCILIYYFFPTVAPAGVVSSPYFNQDQYNLVTRFYEIHQWLPITAWGQGIVSFPSGHVIYALLILIAWRKIKVVFYPLMVINFFLIIATMALGYHYLVDVLASLIIVALTVPLVNYMNKR
jgi:membrane-associated phospholipid phosphatase